jgi:hypothetical protein
METYVLFSNVNPNLILLCLIVGAVFRYKLDAFDDTNNTFCREIQINGDPQPEAVFFFDKNWLHNTSGNQPCTLDVLLENGNEKSFKKMRFKYLPENQLGKNLHVHRPMRILHF